MAGTQTAGYDMVIQFSEDFYEDIIGSNFDINGIVPKILEALHINSDIFTIAVSLDRPIDIDISNSVNNPIDISIDVGTNGSLGNIRIVVGAVMIRTESDKDILTIDFDNSLYYAKATFTIRSPIDISTIIKNITNPIPILPLPVVRDTTDSKVLKRADFKIIDDTSIENKNVLSTMLTFGNGNQGQFNQLDSFVDDSGAIGIFFGWLCRLIIPRLEESLGLPNDSFINTSMECNFNGKVKIDEDEDIYLRSISLRLVDGSIQFDASVSTDGFCYEARGDISAQIRFVIEEGRLKVIADIGDPDIDLDIPWYCYVAGAAIGALTGGLLFGIIGAVVGTVLIPLITWIVAEIVEGTFDDIADSIRDSLNDNLPEVDIAAYGIEILFQDVFIDDIIMKTKAIIHESFPVRTEGTILLPLGKGIDLDKGIVSSAHNPLNDINWEGESLNKYLSTGCEVAIADTYMHDIQEIMHFKLNGYNYKSQQKLHESEFGRISGGSFFNPFYEFDENKKVLAVKTNGGRYSLIQIVEVEENHIPLNERLFLENTGDWVRLRYKTFEGTVPTVNILGNFSCTQNSKNMKEVSVRFIPNHTLTIKNNSVSQLKNSGVLRKENLPENIKIKKIKPIYPGNWTVTYENNSKAKAKAQLRAVSSAVNTKTKYLWTLGTHDLEDNTEGILTIDAKDVHYKVKGSLLILTIDGKANIEMLVKVTLLGTDGCSIHQTRCIKHHGKCITSKRYIPTWKEHKLLYEQNNAVVNKQFILRKNKD